MVEKGSELAEGDPNRKFKYRVVFQGNNVVTQNWEAALFQDLGSSPASMETSKAADAYGSMLGHDLQQADAEQAYVQAFLEGRYLDLLTTRMYWAQRLQTQIIQP